MQPFKSNKQQLDALEADATKLWIPIPDLVHIPTVGEMLGRPLSNRFIGNLITTYSPLQPGEQYFVQEEFKEMPPTRSITNRYGRQEVAYLYKSTYTFNGSHIDWQPTDQMTEQQSRFKFTVTNVEIKQVQDISVADYIGLGFTDGGTGGSIYFNGTAQESLDEWHDSQYPNTPYSSNPHGFLVSIERI